MKSQCQSPTLLRTPVKRQFSQSIRFTYPRKDSQDKDSINTEATEYSKSATDDEGARQEDVAFNPDITDPQKQKDKAGDGTGEGTVSDQVLNNPCLEPQPGMQIFPSPLASQDKKLDFITFTTLFNYDSGC